MTVEEMDKARRDIVGYGQYVCDEIQFGMRQISESVFIDDWKLKYLVFKLENAAECLQDYKSMLSEMESMSSQLKKRKELGNE